METLPLLPNDGELARKLKLDQWYSYVQHMYSDKDNKMRYGGSGTGDIVTTLMRSCLLG